MKSLSIALVAFVALSVAAFAQDPNPATSLPTFSISASVLSLPSAQEASAATDIGATFAVTDHWLLRSDNILAPAVSTQAYFGGVQGPIPYLNTLLAAKTHFDAAHFQPYLTASAGISHITVGGVDSQHFAALAGGGLNYDPTGKGKFSINLAEVRWAKLPGLSNSTVVVASGLKIGF